MEIENNRIKLAPVWEKRLKIARFFVYFIFVLGIFWGMYLILFPSANFVFSFKNPNSSKNTVVDPRIENGEFARSGKVENEKKLVFDTNPLGDFSEVEIEFYLDSKSLEADNGEISVRRSFRSFFYPDGEKIENSEGIDFPRLLSANNSVFIASQEKIWPIADATIFTSMGWDWNDILISNSEEIANYEKQKLFTLKSPHPDGTIFSDKETGKYYLIENGKKREIENEENFASAFKMNPVIAQNKGLETKKQCQLEKSLSFGKKYKCVISIEEMRKLVGNDFQFEANFGNSVKINEISVTFKKSFNMENLNSSISLLKSRIKANYGQAQ